MFLAGPFFPILSACNGVVPPPRTTTKQHLLLEVREEQLCIQLTRIYQHAVATMACYMPALPKSNQEPSGPIHLAPRWASMPAAQCLDKITPIRRSQNARKSRNHYIAPESYSFTRTPYREKYPHLGTWLFLPDLKSKTLQPSLATLGGVYTALGQPSGRDAAGITGSAYGGVRRRSRCLHSTRDERLARRPCRRRHSPCVRPAT